MRRIWMASLALLPLAACEDDSDKTVPRGEELCAIVDIMDELCEEWRDEEDLNYAAGCYSAAHNVAMDRYPLAHIGPDLAGLSPDPDSCSE